MTLCRRCGNGPPAPRSLFCSACMATAQRRSQARQRRRRLHRDAVVAGLRWEDLAALWEEMDLTGCTYCGAPMEHLDHLVPLAKGGEHTIYNLRPACAPCNLAKGQKTAAEFMATRRPA